GEEDRRCTQEPREEDRPEDRCEEDRTQDRGPEVEPREERGEEGDEEDRHAQEQPREEDGSEEDRAQDHRTGDEEGREEVRYEEGRSQDRRAQVSHPEGYEEIHAPDREKASPLSTRPLPSGGGVGGREPGCASLTRATTRSPDKAKGRIRDGRRNHPRQDTSRATPGNGLGARLFLPPPPAPRPSPREAAFEDMRAGGASMSSHPKGEGNPGALR